MYNLDYSQPILSNLRIFPEVPPTPSPLDSSIKGYLLVLLVVVDFVIPATQCVSIFPPHLPTIFFFAVLQISPIRPRKLTTKSVIEVSKASSSHI